MKWTRLIWSGRISSKVQLCTTMQLHSYMATYMQSIHRATVNSATVNAFLILTGCNLDSVLFTLYLAMGDNLHQVNICCVFCQLWSIAPVKLFTACGADLSTQICIVILIPLHDSNLLLDPEAWFTAGLPYQLHVANICIILRFAVILYFLSVSVKQPSTLLAWMQWY